MVEKMLKIFWEGADIGVIGALLILWTVLGVLYSVGKFLGAEEITDIEE